MTTKPLSAKKAVTLIQEAFAAEGARIQLKNAYDLYARLLGHKSWATASAAKKTAAPQAGPAQAGPAHSAEAIAKWPRWVVTVDTNPEGVETLYVLPPQLSLTERQKRAPYSFSPYEDDRIELTSGFTDPRGDRSTWTDLVAVTELVGHYPNARKYGFPVFANDRELPAWLEQTLGWGYLSREGHCAVELDVTDTGDSTSERWWVTLAVHPSVHQRVVAALASTQTTDAASMR